MLVRELRYQGCTLPIELWFNGEKEVSKEGVVALREWGVSCQDFQLNFPFPINGKFSFKVAAMFMCSFDEFLYLDADNNVLRDPTFLFDTDLYRKHKVLFWHDYWRLEKGAACYKCFPSGVKPVFPKFAQESGQVMVDRRQYWAQLWAVLLICESDLRNLFPLPYNHGDKDVFHVTWSAQQQPFSFVPYRTGSLVSGITVGPEGYVKIPKGIDFGAEHFKVIGMVQRCPSGGLAVFPSEHGGLAGSRIGVESYVEVGTGVCERWGRD